MMCMLALWQLGRYRATVMLTTLPYNRFKSYWANTNIYQNLIYRHDDNNKHLVYASKQGLSIPTFLDR